jgi:hypothetical protein
VSVPGGSAAGLGAGGPQQCDLVLDAPWSLGIFPLAGAVQEIRQAGYTINRCAGVSAGAFIAALVASYGAKGIALSQMQIELRGLNLALLHWRRQEREYLNGEFLSRFLYIQLRQLGVVTFADLRIAGPSGAPAAGGDYRLVIYARSGERILRLPYDYPSIGLDPGRQSVSQAVLAAGTGPAFPPLRTGRGASGGPVAELTDAFAHLPVPADCFDGADGRPRGGPTIAVAVRPGIARVMPAASPADAARTIMIDLGPTPLLQANPSAETQTRLFELGGRAARTSLPGLGDPPAAAGPAAPAAGTATRTVPFEDVPLYLAGVTDAAMYVASGGAPFIYRSCMDFALSYLKACRGQTGGHLPRSGASLMMLVTMPRRRMRILMLLYVLFVAPRALLLSGGRSALVVLQRGIRSIPPLITAVVVVFVTGDAWRILGTGFTPRFFALVVLFLLVSLLFLIRFGDYWEQDIDVAATGHVIDLDDPDDEAAVLLCGIRDSMDSVSGRGPGGRRRGRRAGNPRSDVAQSSWLRFWQLIEWGAAPVPLEKPAGRLGRAYVYGSYVLLSAFFLIFVALFVAAALILVGLILISAKETTKLAGSADVYLPLWGHAVITRQLVSLSLSLGAFAAFFLVAAQRAEDRREFTASVLVGFRQALLAYTVYRRACAHAAEWTGVPVRLDQAPDSQPLRERV